ncbi:hypothetical protein ACFWJM_05990 [Streptomyces sp. NPDC127077]|uniref:hypothetical protein n=1 Tax=Streptomyces sp. NPDC127077 TaxID=3347131 RepID=UPI0036645BEC
MGEDQDVRVTVVRGHLAQTRYDECTALDLHDPALQAWWQMFMVMGSRLCRHQVIDDRERVDLTTSKATSTGSR